MPTIGKTRRNGKFPRNVQYFKPNQKENENLNRVVLVMKLN